VLGEALIDFLDGHRDDETIDRQAIGGAPLNVAVSRARLGGTPSNSLLPGAPNG
jgi:fructokinase